MVGLVGAGVRYECPVTCRVAGVAGAERLLHTEESSEGVL